jgi:hypothetical protein
MVGNDGGNSGGAQRSRAVSPRQRSLPRLRRAFREVSPPFEVERSPSWAMPGRYIRRGERSAAMALHRCLCSAAFRTATSTEKLADFTDSFMQTVSPET